MNGRFFKKKVLKIDHFIRNSQRTLKQLAEPFSSGVVSEGLCVFADAGWLPPKTLCPKTQKCAWCPTCPCFNQSGLCPTVANFYAKWPLFSTVFY